MTDANKEAPAATGAGEIEDAQWLLENYGAGHPRIRRIAEALLRAQPQAREEATAKAELYDHMKAVAEANGFASLTEAIAVAYKAREEAKPVAWRFRDHPNSGWVYTGLGGRHDGCEVQPLFTSPPSQPLAEGADAEKLRSALEDLVSWFTKPVQGERGLVWVIPAGNRGADDAVAAASDALKEGVGL